MLETHPSLSLAEGECGPSSPVHGPARVLNTCSSFFLAFIYFGCAGSSLPGGLVSSPGGRGLLPVAAPGFLILVASLFAEHGL